MNNKEQKCCICHKTFIGYGNNPFPIYSTGKCCDTCNKNIVIPERYKLILRKD